MEEHLGTLAAIVAGIIAALIQWRGKRGAMRSAAGLTAQLLVVIGGVEETGRENPDAGELTKKRIREAAVLTGAEADLAATVKRFTGVIR
jgi:hypothetical protein